MWRGATGLRTKFSASNLAASLFKVNPPLTAAEGEVSNPPDRMAADFSIVSSLIVDDDLQQ